MGKHVGFGSTTKTKTLKEHVQGLARFQYFRDGNLFYRTDSGLVFGVPVTDVGNATFMASDKAVMFMRWIRKHMELSKIAVTVVVDPAMPPNTAVMVDPANPENRVIFTNLGTDKVKIKFYWNETYPETLYVMKHDQLSGSNVLYALIGEYEDLTWERCSWGTNQQALSEKGFELIGEL